MKFDFSKSDKPDLQNKLSINKLDIINKNILYLTHEVDKCLIILKRIELDDKLQTQVEEFYPDQDDKEPD